MSFKDNKIYTVIFTGVFTFIFIIILAFVNNITSEKVKNNNLLFKQSAILGSMGITYVSDEEVLKKYKNNIIEITKKDTDEQENIKFYTNKEHTIIAVPFQGKGLWGTIYGILAVNKDVTRIRGMEIISHSETPGLGGRIEEDWFKKQFNNEKISNNKIKVDLKSSGKGNYNNDDSTIDSITGASRTSESIEKIINEAINFIYKNKDIINE